MLQRKQRAQAIYIPGLAVVALRRITPWSGPAAARALSKTTSLVQQPGHQEQLRDRQAESPTALPWQPGQLAGWWRQPGQLAGWWRQPGQLAGYWLAAAPQVRLERGQAPPAELPLFLAK